MLGLDNGTITVSATETALHCCLFQAVEDFNEQYPNVRFKILNNSTVDSIQALKAGKIDLAVVSSAPFQVAAPLKMKTLRSYHDVLIGGSKFAHLKGRRVSLEELKDCSWISLTAETITRNFLNKYFEEHGLQFSPDIELATTDMILPAVRHNLGIGFVPAEIAAEDIRRGTVFEITVAEKLPERHILLVQDTESPQSIASKARCRSPCAIRPPAVLCHWHSPGGPACCRRRQCKRRRRTFSGPAGAPARPACSSRGQSKRASARGRRRSPPRFPRGS